jgi:hypothetical protein
VKLPRNALDVRIDLCWPDYQQLLADHGLDTNALQIRTWGSCYIKRPLKIYRKYALTYTQYSSLIMYSRADNSIGCVQIARNRDGDDVGEDTDNYYGP